MCDDEAFNGRAVHKNAKGMQAQERVKSELEMFEGK